MQIPSLNKTSSPKRTTKAAKDTSNNSSSSRSDATACAACKYQRRRCRPDCPLARHFPADAKKPFSNVHRFFGLKKVLKVVKNNTKTNRERENTIKCMIIEANIRANDPVGGCHRIIVGLEKQIQLCKMELDHVNQLLHFSQVHNYMKNVVDVSSTLEENVVANMVG
ncbi:OLC1v1023250C1 [Oldenlandia corymbosa var. corymbosa]|uniref:OLC1v1023250C1 n=1 Tax=Oldenlandia corymbosa var. corymbosa TaxID=529605 RepID=A0AAV1C2G8_OLDCO|nr:OLC1v1023250C1 [Oldenlandia corymbosa var. corymbosa]